ncbi:putative methyltransferase-like protein C27D7.08c [Cyphellophora attinorum]|uniref:Putative methyltransferase-like protein C27D7.08c n=1 Tax=Cyphellophora attinorum TaxID=1664694 RepID=A0A0N1HUT9_9EURO|nr:putative methyltransferase-like protein C27D7.08c [Phialophora attinorum]KPI40832.1 putative methyltransferase-like protein C27D7.08c [Phialophora attinorum]
MAPSRIELSTASRRKATTGSTLATTPSRPPAKVSMASISSRHTAQPAASPSPSTSTFTLPELNADGSLVHPLPPNFYSNGGSRVHGAGDDDDDDDANVSTDGSSMSRTQPGEIDFRALARKHEGFAKVLKKNGQVDFADPESVKQLTLALALTNHALDLHLPPDRLCPPIPNRFNYILFLERLLAASRPLTATQYLNTSNGNTTSAEEVDEDEDDIRGVDIGTGASAIYPLLALRQHGNWRMLATELDSESLACARDNVRTNGLAARCTVIETQPPIAGNSDEGDAPEDDENTSSSAQRQYLFPYHQLLRLTGPQSESDFPIKIDFTMTNPPFYVSQQEMLTSAALKKRPPNSACTGAAVEMVYADGGEVGFVRRLVEESSLLHRQRRGGRRVRVQWWTSTLGKLSSVSAVVEILRELSAGVIEGDGKQKQKNNVKGKALNYVVAEFRQGSKTKRWAVGWSWEGWRYAQPPVAGQTDIGNEARRTGAADADVEMGDGDANGSSIFSGNNKHPELVFRIAVVPTTSTTTEGADYPQEAAIIADWLFGFDAVLYESFCGWLRRRVRETLEQT